jgi:tRNA threonylcarbamoyladenosine biosynthesis protein TsaE
VAVRTVETSDPQQTEALGAELAGELENGDVVLVRGELGAGKTTLVRGAARALGVTDPVTSPTFSIGHRYAGRELVVSHLDLYRVASIEDEDPGLLGDYLGEGRIAFVEWPEDDAGELAGARMRVTLTHRGGDRRLIEVGEQDAGGHGRPIEAGEQGVGGDGRPLEVGEQDVGGGPVPR